METPLLYISICNLSEEEPKNALRSVEADPGSDLPHVIMCLKAENYMLVLKSTSGHHLKGSL